MNKNLSDLTGEELGAYCAEMKGKLLSSDAPLSPEDEKAIEDALNELESEIDALEKVKLEIGMVCDYNAMKKRGVSAGKIGEYIQEDMAFVDESERCLKANIDYHDYHFGYPLNMVEYSHMIQYLRRLESKTFVMNNCGDPYQGGNSRMDSKKIERMILAQVAANYGLKDGEYWGYMTSGGTEGNFWAIREGFSRFAAHGKKARLYFSEDTHYSVVKFVAYGGKNTYDYEIVKSNPDGTIDTDALKKSMERDLCSGYDGVILLLNWGTTCKGAIDDVHGIVSYLNEKGITYYCHVDAALYGGIANNQENAPAIRDIKSWGIDSVSVSLYKYIGAARINGVVLSLTHRLNRSVIEYIGQEDSTFLGSRDCLPFSTYQRVKDMLERCESTSYDDNVEYFKDLLEKNSIPYDKYPNGNIFVIDCPSSRLCKKYQLATFFSDTKAHVIIFPFHKKEIMDEMVKDIAEERR